MSKRFVLLCSLIMAFAVSFTFTQPAECEELARVKMPNDVGIELLGKALAYEFYYQRTVTPFLGLEGGLGVLGGGSDEENTTIVLIPLGAKVYIIPKDGSIFLAGGVTIASVSADFGPFGEDDESGTWGYLGGGFEYRSQTGLLFRGAAYGLIASGGFFIWPGLTIGYAF